METALLDLIRTEVLDTAEELTPEGDLFAAGLDSMGIMQLLLAIEDRFGVALDPADLSRANFSSVGKIAALVAARRSADHP
jgi:acyl carrier protein